MKESITHLQAFITELVNEAVQTALVQRQDVVQQEQVEQQVKAEVMNADQAAEFLHIAKQTLYSMTSRRKIPFRRGDLEEWLNSGKQEQVSKIQQRGYQFVHQNPIKR
jgi:hypothetical protein